MMTRFGLVHGLGSGLACLAGLLILLLAESPVPTTGNHFFTTSFEAPQKLVFAHCTPLVYCWPPSRLVALVSQTKTEADTHVERSPSFPNQDPPELNELHRKSDIQRSRRSVHYPDPCRHQILSSRFPASHGGTSQPAYRRKVFVKYVGRTGATAAAVGTLAADAASNIGPTQLISAMIMPFRPVRFEAMFSGAVTGGAIFHIAYYSAASSTTKIVRLLFHLVFTKFGPADTPVVLTAYLPNISSENLTFKCPLTSPIKGVFTCKTTVEYDSTAVPAAVGKLRLFDALGTVASTSVNLTPRFNLTINGQNEPAYYGPP
ncbi:unnamed protein product [Closterium sp. NIES-53]